MRSDPIRVLLVTDSIAESQHPHAKGVEKILTELSYKVTIAKSKPDIYQQLQTGVYDLFLLDHEPSRGFDARPLLEQLGKEQRLSHIPSVVMSFQDDQDTVAACLHAGADGFLTKPCRRNELNNLWVHVWRASQQLLEAAGPEAQARRPGIIFKRRESTKSGGDEGSGNGTSGSGSQYSDVPSTPSRRYAVDSHEGETKDQMASAPAPSTQTPKLPSRPLPSADPQPHAVVTQDPAPSAPETKPEAPSNGTYRSNVIKPSAFKAYLGSQVPGQKRALSETENGDSETWRRNTKFQAIGTSCVRPAPMPQLNITAPVPSLSVSKPQDPPTSPTQRKIASPPAQSAPVVPVQPVAKPPAATRRPAVAPYHTIPVSRPQHPANVAMMQGNGDTRHKLITAPRKHPANEAMELAAGGGPEMSPFPACSISRMPHPANEAMLRETNARMGEHLASTSLGPNSHPANAAMMQEAANKAAAANRAHPANTAMLMEQEKASAAARAAYHPHHPAVHSDPHHPHQHPAYATPGPLPPHMQYPSLAAAHPSMYPGFPPHPAHSSTPYDHTHPAYPPAASPSTAHAHPSTTYPPFGHRHPSYSGLSTPYYPGHPHPHAHASDQSYQQSVHKMYPGPHPMSPYIHDPHTPGQPDSAKPHSSIPHSHPRAPPHMPGVSPVPAPQQSVDTSSPAVVHPGYAHIGMLGRPAPPATVVSPSDQPPPGGELSARNGSAGSRSTNGGSGLSGSQAAAVGSNGESTVSAGADRLQARQEALKKYQSKKESRCFEKKILYSSRKQLAEQRPRVQGKFTRSSNSKSSSDDTGSNGRDTANNMNMGLNGSNRTNSSNEDNNDGTRQSISHSSRMGQVPGSGQSGGSGETEKEEGSGVSGNSGNSQSAEC
mmetsp:Transcript_12322/g.14732  ORF Transcript_12322/g.14732 Transcript_12322/m.14732 type:complete len:887 (+) Transcript_12322:431-3091(+)|eukprot:CAMPEP_0197854856 /NCGR_PEP_ID=MMETSP1438-20131217/25460_1 /TAXON_ID=1461541 /ORGANISM="Pterosperma sp., Strain CCMP1384" /LENGTH=886 /DNA_ID=CAMNT_0043469747 /DNA_START=424 /DNA_END=3084 /DNA_ORIENTATION=+